MRHLLLLSVLMILASCAPQTETVYVPPPAAWGNAGSCIEQCDIQQFQCRQNAATSAGACRTADSAIAAGFNGCRAGSPGCVTAPICLADLQSCTEGYNACFNSCGGLVRSVRVRPVDPNAMPTEPFIVPPLGGSPAAGSGSGRVGQPIRIRRPQSVEPY